ncbi:MULTISPECIES: adenylyltransferase/cytidyltransferase family protein [unclassified Desulfovibrio]|uniref:adenylyltransferase/cytidyltransferase family protein n=1 Tax=unclassified Desulfovibrio TaxID=2593640 RepID=UPI0013EB09EF|nr:MULTISPECIES: adenylyltransferase/cytidyltransferase family protein [unclassified Desulfovibrio]
MQPRILTVGVFDYFHYGHVRLFNQIKSLYPRSHLIVAVQDEDSILKYKPDAIIFYSTEVRCELVRALRLVDEVITYKNVADIVREADFDIFAVGEDQDHPGFRRAIGYCRRQGREILRLSRTPNISSTTLKENFTCKGDA